MEKQRIFFVEKLLLFFALTGALWGFWYFEESILLKYLALGLSVYAISTSFFRKAEKPQFSSKNEFTGLLILYLGAYTFYNLLYGMNIPLYLVMIAFLVMVVIIFFTLFNLDKNSEIIGNDLFRVFIAAMGLVILEIFLALSFWPINPESKSLIIVVIFYLVISLVYLHIHSMLRLRKIVGFLIASLFVLGLTILFIWIGLSR